MLRFTDFKRFLSEVEKDPNQAPYRAYISHVRDELAKDKPFDGDDKHLVSNAGIVAGLKLAAAAAAKKPDGPEAQVLAKAMTSLKVGADLHTDEASKEVRDALHKIAKQTPMIQTVYAAMSADDKSNAIKFLTGLEKEVAQAQVKVKAKVVTPDAKAAVAVGKKVQPPVEQPAAPQ